MPGTRRRRWWAWLVGILIVVVIIVGVGLGLLYAGVYNVSANYSDNAAAAWFLSTAMDSSVRRHARGIKAPPLNDPAMIRAGLAHYRDMCAQCHGAPGVPVGELGKGLNPKPPRLTDAAEEWKPNELFWVTKHGVRMTGMPAWGVTHSDKIIWDIVAFMEKMPSMSPAEYRALSREVPHEHEEPE